MSCTCARVAAELDGGGCLALSHHARENISYMDHQEVLGDAYQFAHAPPREYAEGRQTTTRLLW